MLDFIVNQQILLKLEEGKNQKEHRHSDAELIYILDGSLTLCIEADRSFEMQRGDVAVVNPMEAYALTASKDALYVVISMPLALIQNTCPMLTSRFECNSVDDKTTDYNELKKLLNNLILNYMYIHGNSDYEDVANYAYVAEYFKLLELMVVQFVKKKSDLKLNKKEKNNQRMLQIYDYLEQNYAQAISLEKMADYLYLSESYLSRYFKQNFDMTFSDYLKNVRLEHARNALIYTDGSVTKIAYDHVFSSESFFNKVFKEKYGETPSVARKNAKEALLKEVSAHTSRQLTDKMEEFLKVELQGEKINTVHTTLDYEIEVGEGKNFDPCWNQLLNIGAAKDILKSEIQEHIYLLKTSLKFKYIRVWSLFASDMQLDIFNEHGQYNFTKIDRVMDYILGEGLIPFIDLDNKINRIIDGKSPAMLDNIIFQNEKQFESLFEALIRHWLKRYGIDEVSRWKIEVWYGGYEIEQLSTEESFFRIFDIVYKKSKQYVPQLEVGGCGIYPGITSDLIYKEQNFWKEWRGATPVPDFVSTIVYAYVYDEQYEQRYRHIHQRERCNQRAYYGKRSTNDRFLAYRIQNLKIKLLEAGMTDVRLYVTEWNLTVSDRNVLSDSCFQGAYVLKNAIDTIGQVDMLGYFSGSDRVSENIDAAQLLFGGNGLLTKDSIFKPSAYAFWFLQKLYTYYVDKGEHYLMTTDNHGNYRMVCHHMVSLNYYYYMTEVAKISREDVWRCFEHEEAKKFHFVMKSIVDGVYTVRIRRVNEQSGSIQNMWRQLDYQTDLRRDDIKYLRKTCEPKLEMLRVKSEDGQLKFEIEMAPNECAYLEIEPD